MALLKDVKFFQVGGLNSDDAIEYRPKNDFFPAYNIRTLGTQSLEEGYVTNIESNELLSASVAPGLSHCIGSAGFESKRIGLGVYWNSAGYNQLREINYDTNEVTTIPITAWPLDPQHYVNDIKLINNTFLLMNDGYNPPFYVNYDRLKAGGYDNTDPNDFMLIKAQPQYAPSASYGNDASRSVNLLAQKEFQFRTVWVGLDYESSNVSTISERFIPPFENTPGQGADVTQNNNLTVSVDAGTDQTATLLVYARYALLDWFSVITIDRAQILTLPTTIDIQNQIYQAYDPATNLFSFVFYNDGLYENISALVTDQLYDNVPLKAGALEVLNGNQVALGDITIGYPRPTTPVTLSTSNYNPNLTLSPSVSQPAFEYSIINPGESGSGEGNHRRLVVLEFGGYIQENDYVTINLVDIRNASNVQSYQFPPCTLGSVGDVGSYIVTNAAVIPNASTYTPTDGQIIGLNIITSPYFTLQSVIITLYNAGAGIFKSVHGLKGNSSYQVALLHYDFWGRPFPIQTDPSYIVHTNSYGQSHGNTPQINWTIQDATAPDGAYTYQFGISPNSSHLTWLFSLASIIQVSNGGTGVYNGATNTFTPSSAGATAGTAWRVDQAGSQNLGNGTVSVNVDDWVVAIGNGAFQIVPSTYGDLSDSTSYYFYFNALQNYNTKYNSSILSYGYTPGDRCTLYYYGNNGAKNWFDGTANPIVDVQVEGYDASIFFLKVNRSSAIDPSVLLGYNVLLEVYTPKPRTSTTVAGVTTNNPTVFYETGQVYKIINGLYQTLTGAITQGDNYFKTRQMGGSIDPNTLYSLVVEDPNYSDFYTSNYYSFGRPRTYNDVLERTEQIANITYSQTYIIGSKNNGLTTFYVADVFGNGGGETSSNYGAIRVMAQINNELLIIQENDHCTAPVFINILEDQAEQQNVAISEKILNNVRYANGKHIGIGKGRRSFAVYNNVCYWIDSNRNEPIRWSGNGAIPISEKMSKYFKATLQAAYAASLQPIGWYDIYNDEYVISTPVKDSIPVSVPFSIDAWQTAIQPPVLPGLIAIISSPAHGSASYNPVTGIATATPASGYVGSDSFLISTPDSPSTRAACYSFVAGSGTVNAFSFYPLTGVALSTELQSNTISVIGNTYAVPISITGDAGLGYSINGGAFTSAPGMVNAGDIVQVEVMSSASNSTSTSCTLTIDSQSAAFTVTTAAAGNFTVYAQYGMSVVSVQDGSATGVPAAFNPCNLSPGQSLTEPYTTLTGSGTISVSLTGTPAIPGHTRLFISINSVNQDSISLSGGGVYLLNTGTGGSDPTAIVVGIETF
jgi:hypothetical protein